jgi:hypothetical protein
MCTPPKFYTRQASFKPRWFDPLWRGYKELKPRWPDPLPRGYKEQIPRCARDDSVRSKNENDCFKDRNKNYNFKDKNKTAAVSAGGCGCL